MKRLEWLENYFEKIVDTHVDPEKEEELAFKCQLDAKISVLKQELNEDRFTAQTEELTKKDDDAAFNYAKTIALLRMEAKDLELKLLNIYERP